MLNTLPQLDKTAYMLKALAHPLRLQIVMLLSRDEKELSVTTIQEHFSISQSLISHHLINMRAKGILGFRQQGNNRYYRLREPRFARCVALLFDEQLVEAEALYD